MWTGSDAKKIGLIDEIGGMNDALVYAKKFVKEEPVILYYPKVKKNKVEQLLQLFEEEEAMVVDGECDNDDNKEVKTPLPSPSERTSTPLAVKRMLTRTKKRRTMKMQHQRKSIVAGSLT